ncbi:MAG: hypothetical protein AAFN41_10710 [Planctomycetota bacterium]
MARRDGTIVVCDGDLGSLVCLTHAAESAVQAADGRKLPIVAFSVATRHAGRARSVKRLANFHGAEIIEADEVFERDTDLLLAAGRLADDRSASTVIWPAHAGIAGDVDAIDVDRASVIANTSVLVERLLELESPAAPVIESPLVDLSDRQVADLAIDLGMVPGDVWWAAGGDDDCLLAAERWSAAFEACGAPLRVADRARGGSGQR